MVVETSFQLQCWAVQKRDGGDVCKGSSGHCRSGEERRKSRSHQGVIFTLVATEKTI